MPSRTLLGTTVGDYRLTEFLGAGGMGEVYRGVHRRHGKVVAVKVLHTTHAGTTLAQRFANEAQIQAQQHHPNIARLYDALEVDGRPALVMEYVDGETLDARICRSLRMPWGEALAVFRDVVGAVAYLHGRGVLHRDIKPHNIKVDRHGTVKLLDFGIAKGKQTPRLTRTGAVIGTPHYLAPEQVRGRPADARSDVWALGVLLYEMLTGRMPFEAPDLLGLYQQIDAGDYVAPSVLARDLPAEVEALIARCLQAQPRRRYADARELETAVAACPAREPQPPVAGVALSWRERLAAFFQGFTMPQRYGIVGALGAFAVALILMVWLLPSPSGGYDPPPGPGRNGGQGGYHTVTIEVIGAPAEVYRDGVRVGQTPYLLRAPLGEHVELTLRRGGVEKPLGFDVTPNTSVYTEVLDARW